MSDGGVLSYLRRVETDSPRDKKGDRTEYREERRRAFDRHQRVVSLRREQAEAQPDPPPSAADEEES